MTLVNACNKSHSFIIYMFTDKETKASKIKRLTQGDTPIFYNKMGYNTQHFNFKVWNLDNPDK